MYSYSDFSTKQFSYFFYLLGGVCFLYCTFYYSLCFVFNVYSPNLSFNKFLFSELTLLFYFDLALLALLVLSEGVIDFSVGNYYFYLETGLFTDILDFDIGSSTILFIFLYSLIFFLTNNGLGSIFLRSIESIFFFFKYSFISCVNTPS